MCWLFDTGENGGNTIMGKVLLIDQIAKVTYKYTFPLANGLCNMGQKITLVIDQKKDRENCQCEVINLFNTSEKNVSKFIKLINYVCSYIKIGRILKKENYDILHTNWYTFSPLDYLFLKKYKKKYDLKYVSTVHDILPFNEKFYDMFFHKKLYELADSIILQADTNMDRFGELFPDFKNKAVMIPLGHTLDYVEEYDKEYSRDQLGIPQDRIVLLFFGQIKKVKGVDVLLKALVELKDKYPQLYLVIAGNVWKTDFSECEEIIINHDLSNSLKLDIRYIPDEEVELFYSASDICVLPYTDVYQSGVLQLAFSHQKPVIATKLPALTQFVQENKTGFLAEVNDSHSLALAICRAINSKDNLENMGKNGYDMVKKRLDWNTLATKIVRDCYKG